MSERETGLFDVRLWVDAPGRPELFALVNEFLDRARAVAPDGVQVRYAQPRRYRAPGQFRPTFEPKRRAPGRTA